MAAGEGHMRMRRNSRLLMVAMLLVCVGFAATRTKVSAGEHFVPPDITSASDIPYPLDNVASGLVSLAVNVDPGGHVQNVQVVRGISGLTAVVTNAVNTWSFSPGRMDGNQVASTINVQVVFNPGTPQTQGLQLLPGALVTPPLPAGYMPPQMAQVSYATYPPTSVGTGTVVLSLLIDKQSGVKKVTPIRPVPSLTEAAAAAVKNWTVNPATLNEKKLDATVVVAFVFRAPINSTP
jgi:outer membrane biosynthesis protein TonB